MKPSYRPDQASSPNTTAGTLLMACRIASRFTHRLPTVQELQAEFGMHKATAYRWRSAMKQARRVEVE